MRLVPPSRALLLIVTAAAISAGCESSSDRGQVESSVRGWFQSEGQDVDNVKCARLTAPSDWRCAVHGDGFRDVCRGRMTEYTGRMPEAAKNMRCRNFHAILPERTPSGKSNP